MTQPPLPPSAPPPRSASPSPQPPSPSSNPVSGQGSARGVIPQALPPAPDKKKKVALRDRSPVLAHLRSVLLTGLITAIPLYITFYIVSAFYGFVTKYTKVPADWMVDWLPFFTGNPFADQMKFILTQVVAVLISVLIVYILGLLGTFFIGRQILAQIEHFIENLPMIKGIYGTIKQVMSVFRQGGGGQGFQRVVLVEFPREGTWTVAFVTNTVRDGQANQTLVCCFIPMTPNPTSGFFQMFPEKQVRNTDWTVDMGIKIVLSGGLLAPSEFDMPMTTASIERAVLPGNSVKQENAKI